MSVNFIGDWVWVEVSEQILCLDCVLAGYFYGGEGFSVVG